MSDLAPFVAAALRDKVVTELLEENEQLRRASQLFRTDIVVADQGGATRYAVAMVDDINCEVTESVEDDLDLVQKTYKFENNPSAEIKNYQDLAGSQLLISAQYPTQHLNRLAKWEVGVPQRCLGNSEGHKHYHVQTRNQLREFEYPELKLEVTYESNQNPDLHMVNRNYGLPPPPGSFWGLFHTMSGRVLDPPPKVRFLSVTLHSVVEAEEDAMQAED